MSASSVSVSISFDNEDDDDDEEESCMRRSRPVALTERGLSMVLATKDTSARDAPAAVPELVPSHRLTILEGLAWMRVVAASMTASASESSSKGLMDWLVRRRSRRDAAWASFSCGEIVVVSLACSVMMDGWMDGWIASFCLVWFCFVLLFWFEM